MVIKKTVLFQQLINLLSAKDDFFIATYIKSIYFYFCKVIEVETNQFNIILNIHLQNEWLYNFSLLTSL